MTLRIATRTSRLARAQVQWVGEALKAHVADLRIEEHAILSKGDRFADQPLQSIGGKGLFVSEVQDMVRTGDADLAVHSLKDMPAEQAPGLCIACVPAREDPRDALLTQDAGSLDTLPRGARIGTSSLRRASQLRSLRPDLVIQPLRGNVGTRIRRLEEGTFDGIVLAMAGLRRLGIAKQYATPLESRTMLPAVGQGCLALELRKDDQETQALVQRICDPKAWTEARAERALLRTLEGNCHAPIAGHATYSEQILRLEGLVARVDGTQVLRCVQEVHGSPVSDDQADNLGVRVAHELLAQGAAQVMAASLNAGS